MKFQGFRFKETEIESVTIRRNGTSVTIQKNDSEKSPRVAGFGAYSQMVMAGKIDKDRARELEGRG